MAKRRTSREIALKILFHLEFNEEPYLSAMERLSVLHQWDEDALKYAKELIQNVIEHKKEIDSYIIKASKNWRLERIGIIERCILRMGIGELCYMRENVPPKVCIDEAVELGKMYGNGE